MRQSTRRWGWLLPFAKYFGTATWAFATPPSHSLQVLYPNHLDHAAAIVATADMPEGVPNPSSELDESPLRHVLDMDRGRSGAFRGHFRFTGDLDRRGELGRNPQWGLMEDPTDPAWIPAGGPPVQRDFDMTDLVAGGGAPRDYRDPQEVVAQIRWHIANFKALDMLRGDYEVTYSDERTSENPTWDFQITGTVPFKILRTGTYTALETLGWEVMAAYALTNEASRHPVIHSEEWIIFDLAETSTADLLPGLQLLGENPDDPLSPLWLVGLDWNFDALNGTAPLATADAQLWGEGGGRSRLQVQFSGDLAKLTHNWMDPLEFVEGRNRFTLWDSADIPTTNLGAERVGETWGSDAKMYPFWRDKADAVEQSIFPARRLIMNLQEQGALTSMAPPRGTLLRIEWDDGGPTFLSVDIAGIEADNIVDYLALIEDAMVAAGAPSQFSIYWDAGAQRVECTNSIDGIGVVDTANVNSAWPWLGFNADQAWAFAQVCTADAAPRVPILRVVQATDRYMRISIVNRGNLTRRVRLGHVAVTQGFYFERGVVQPGFKGGAEPQTEVTKGRSGTMSRRAAAATTRTEAELQFVTELDQWLFESTFVAPYQPTLREPSGHGLQPDKRFHSPRACMLLDPVYHPMGYNADAIAHVYGAPGTAAIDAFRSTLWARGLYAGYGEVESPMTSLASPDQWSARFVISGLPPGY